MLGDEVYSKASETIHKELTSLLFNFFPPLFLLFLVCRPERSACPVLLGAETCTTRRRRGEKDDQKADANVDYNLDSLAHFLTADGDLFFPLFSLHDATEELFQQYVSLLSPRRGERSPQFVKVRMWSEVRSFLT